VQNVNSSGKAVLVTGAGSGLGEATARLFAESGHAVACVDVNAAAAQRVAHDLGGPDGGAIALECDVRNAEAVEMVIQDAVAEFGRLDVLVNNAAVDHTVAIEEMTVEQWDQVLDVNLRAAFLTARAVMPVMKRQGGGHIVNIASTAATRAWSNAAAYHASKWGLIGFSRALGVEGRPYGIRTTTVIPGGMRTHFFDRFREQGIPMPESENLQDPANVARVILFATQVPPESALQEVMITPVTETSWP
jgi:NAD(P)-dependent dehydrogenase (short-subunit alcohol dehydrogenase family)